MPVFVRFKRVGTFNKLRDKYVKMYLKKFPEGPIAIYYHIDFFRTTEPGGLPNKLNELRTFYGKLENPLDLNLGCEEFQDEGMGDVFQSTFDFVKKVSERGTPLVNVSVVKIRNV
ncbi:hypothetical protein NEIG_02668 [Nematocida sp. ERTm5]|nr:hypothetical protein NEIG_02668 [Nematocida sp. ERTm5]